MTSEALRLVGGKCCNNCRRAYVVDRGQEVKKSLPPGG